MMLSRSMVLTLFKAAREYMKTQMLHAQWAPVHFMPNIWTSQGVSNAYLLLTVHWWQVSDTLGRSGESSDRQGEGCQAGYCKAVLHVEPLDLVHTVDNIAITFSEYLALLVGSGGLTKRYLVTNGGSNMVVPA